MWTQRRVQQQSQRNGDHRSPYQRDKARILHSAAFRRLQAKTQVLGVGMSDFYRTRLTHSLEASQIGQGIVAQLRNKFAELTETLNLDEHLIEALCLAHDIGHPPYGHGGEIALNCVMHPYGGFEGNGQTFRIITQLEPYTPDAGMNLSRRTVLGLVKYPQFLDALQNRQSGCDKPDNLSQVKASDWLPPKGLYRCDQAILDWVLAPLNDDDRALFCSYDCKQGAHHKTRFKSFDCSIMELADDIAYGIHDLEDAIVMGIVTRDAFEKEVTQPLRVLEGFALAENMSELTNKLFSSAHYERKDAIGALVNVFITCIEIAVTDEHFAAPLLRFNAELPGVYARALAKFKAFVLNRVIRKPEIQLLEYKGQQVVMSLFEALSSDPQRLLPDNTRQRWMKAEQQNNGMRVIADYISGMTDGFAARLHQTLFTPNSGHVYDNHNL